jgi:hypothetical protein
VQEIKAEGSKSEAGPWHNRIYPKRNESKKGLGGGVGNQDNGMTRDKNACLSSAKALPEFKPQYRQNNNKIV